MQILNDSNIIIYKKGKIGNDKEMAQSERSSAFSLKAAPQLPGFN